MYSQDKQTLAFESAADDLFRRVIETELERFLGRAKQFVQW
ncbi:MAG: hypothetical protein ACJAY7_001914 [Pseudohongiellaceae bacterium]|jgi:hypothetical protein